MKVAAVRDCRELGRRRLPHLLFEYVDAGAGAEVTLRRNVAERRAMQLNMSR